MTHTQTSSATGADPHDGDPGGLSMENVRPADLQAEPWEQTTYLGGPGRGREESGSGPWGWRQGHSG